MSNLAEKIDTSRPAAYVGTYGKYNNGSIAGAWLYLDDFASKSDFIDACLALHKDDPDPELMFQDWENTPGKFVSECSIDADFWEFLELDDSEREMIAEYWDEIDDSADVQYIRDAYHGCWDSFDDFASEYVDSTGMLGDAPETLARYFDFAAFARDLAYDYDITESGHVFCRC